MKKKVWFILGMVSLMIFVSCKGSNEKDGLATLSFEYKENMSLSEFISDIEYVCLETNERCQIGSIKQLLKHNNRYYILDAPVGRKIYMFDEKGRYIKHIDRTGQGPGEYVMPYSIAINKQKNELIVNDFVQHKMLVFDAVTLDFIREYAPKIEALQFCFLNENNDMAWYNVKDMIHKGNKYPCHVVTTKDDGSFINKMVPVEFSTGYILNPYSSFFQTDTSTLFSHPYQGHVYRIWADRAEELFCIDFQKHPFPTKEYLERTANNKNFVPAMRRSGYVNYFETFESVEHYSFNFFAADTYFLALHAKASNKSLYFPISLVEGNSIRSVIKDDIGIVCFNSPIACIDNSYYSVILPVQIMDGSKEHIGNVHPQLQKIIGKIKEEDNPLILKYKLGFK